eukprot:GHVU01212859.1.p1 GENE.GHVU01212859.1~~GHVU01212859.1.p1  ORF type:complete len:106 (-),score=11.18 GHVU01212859.1:341-658(-)
MYIFTRQVFHLSHRPQFLAASSASSRVQAAVCALSSILSSHTYIHACMPPLNGLRRSMRSPDVFTNTSIHQAGPSSNSLEVELEAEGCRVEEVTHDAALQCMLSA